MDYGVIDNYLQAIGVGQTFHPPRGDSWVAIICRFASHFLSHDIVAHHGYSAPRPRGLICRTSPIYFFTSSIFSKHHYPTSPADARVPILNDYFNHLKAEKQVKMDMRALDGAQVLILRYSFWHRELASSAISLLGLSKFVSLISA